MDELKQHFMAEKSTEGMTDVMAAVAAQSTTNYLNKFVEARALALAQQKQQNCSRASRCSSARLARRRQISKAESSGRSRGGDQDEYAGIRGGDRRLSLLGIQKARKICRRRHMQTRPRRTRTTRKSSSVPVIPAVVSPKLCLRVVQIL